MMEDTIDQFLAEQREHVEYAQRERDGRERERRRNRDRDSRERRSESRGDRRRDRDRDRDRRRERSRERSRSRERDWGPPENGWERGGGSPMERGEWVGGGWDGRHDPPQDYRPPPPMRLPHLPEYDRDGYEYPPRRESPPSHSYLARPPAYEAELATPEVYDYDHRSTAERPSSAGRPEYRDPSRGAAPGREDRGGEKWITDIPTNTVMLKGLPQNVDEQDIRVELQMFGAPIKELRLMKRQNGVSRGFAFVEFQCVEDARRWMDTNQGSVTLNHVAVKLCYSKPKNGHVDTRHDAFRSDWICSKCGAHNFKRRDYCFKCHISKEDSERTKEGDGFDQIGSNPCNTLIFRGLDALTTEENLIAAINRYATVTVKNIKVIRDEATGTSRGYGFAEFGSIQESTQLLDILKNLQTPFEVDGKAVLRDFAKNTFTTTMATIASTAYAPAAAGQAGWDQYGGQAPVPGAEYSAYYAQGGPGQAAGVGYHEQAAGQLVPYSDQYYQDYYAHYGHDAPPPPGPHAKLKRGDTTNAAAAVAQAAIQQAQAAKQYQKQHEEVQKQVVAQIQQQQKLADMTPEQRLAHQAQEWSQSTQSDEKEYTKYPVPDVSTYQYDESSGYYYDPTTSLYYDANTQYYYNSQTGSFLYWDGEKQTYLPATPGENEKNGTPSSITAPTTTTMTATSPNTTTAENEEERKEDEGKTKKDKEKKEKVKIAKKIAKDMEKWAKSLNAQKDAMKEVFKKNFQPIGNSAEKESAAADAGFAVLEKKSYVDRKGIDVPFMKRDDKLMPPPPAPGGSAGAGGGGGGAGDIPGLVASYGGDSDSENEEETIVDETKLVDLSKMACLLCKRQFPNKDALTRHIQLSDLHKKNLETFRKNQAENASQEVQYRDRAKERRKKYGVPEPPAPRGRKAAAEEASAPVPYEQPTKAGVPSENIGNKLLQKMGWSEGMGLGKANQGITNPVEAMSRQQGAGLGSRGASYNVQAGETYKDTVKKIMYARFKELE